MADLNNVRRVYLHKRVIARRLDSGLEPVWQAKQEEVSATSLPAGFPHKTTLAAVGYTTTDDLDGADTDELVDFVALTQREAEAVIAAFEAL